MPFQANPQSGVPAQYQIKYANTWETQIGQMNEKFASRGMLVGDWTERQYVDTDLTTGEWVESTGQRFGQTQAGTIGTGNRSGFRRQADFAVKFDRLDDQFLSNLGLPTSQVMQDAKRKLNKLKDRWFIEAAVASSLGGPHPYITPLAFPTANIIAADFTLRASYTETGLTPHKLLEAMKRMETLDIDPTEDTCYVAISPKQKLDLIVFAEKYTNDTYASIVSAWLKDPNSKLMGFVPIVSNNLPIASGTNIRTCVAFCDRGFKVAPSSMTTHFDTLPTERHAQQIAHYTDMGVFRSKDEYVYQILCDED